MGWKKYRFYYVKPRGCCGSPFILPPPQGPPSREQCPPLFWVRFKQYLCIYRAMFLQILLDFVLAKKKQGPPQKSNCSLTFNLVICLIFFLNVKWRRAIKEKKKEKAESGNLLIWGHSTVRTATANICLEFLTLQETLLSSQLRFRTIQEGKKQHVISSISDL